MTTYKDARWESRLPYFENNETWSLIDFLQWSIVFAKSFGDKQDEHLLYKVCLEKLRLKPQLLKSCSSELVEKLVSNCISSFEKDIKSSKVKEFWDNSSTVMEALRNASVTNSKNIIHQVLGLQTDFSEVLSNTTRETIQPALKRKSTVMDESDSDATKTDESNVSNAPEDIEDVLTRDNIIDDEKVEEHNLEKSWEFKEPIPGWLKLLHQHREDLATTIDLKSLSQVAETAIWWRVIDTCDPKLTEIITEREFLNLSESLLSNLPSDWEVLEPPAERCLHSIAMLDKKGLKKILTTSNKCEDENPFLDSPPTEITTIDNFFQDGDYKHPDVYYIIELLHYTYNMIDKKIPQRENSERDIDVIFKSHMFSCFDDIMDSHFGEMVSRASRQRRTQAIDASDKAEGYHLDWLFTRHDLARDLTWGREFSLCERAGSKIENGRKILDNTLKVQKTLRDMHQTLLETLSNAGGGAVPVKVAQAFRKLLLPGFISSRFFIRVLLNVYIGGKYHGSVILAEFDVPTRFDEMSKIVTIARMMLNIKNIFKQTIRTFTLMEEASKKKKHSVDNVLVPSRVKEHVSPRAKKQQSSKTKKRKT
ncbi:2964_t:CDS:10 [Funneliformis mosseae]|uniref:2964_t:CDS:1 n=1 Tax=Funneliformis mosseae TaxID=27381 RepID=A0A9N9N5X8_FUNMO|nr:2964_t:CDS:10 [Funneliformis mosseae]